MGWASERGSGRACTVRFVFFVSPANNDKIIALRIFMTFAPLG